MNALYGIYRFDQQPLDPGLLEKAKFCSPKWKPDHSEIYHHNYYATASTQRFITPECGLQTAPYYDKESGVIATGDLYLTNHSDLAKRLGISQKNSDLYLATAAYLKWGEECINYLCGNFLLIFFDTHKQSFFIAVDHFNNCGCYYTFVPNKYLIFSNTINTFKVFDKSITVNDSLFYKLATNQELDNSTCLESVKKVRAASYILVNSANLQEKKYWDLRKTQGTNRYHSREDYYSAFRNEFSLSIRQSLRTSSQVMAHYSGGLDSSSVASIAAIELEKENKKLFTFTAIPKHLSGDSHRAGFKYHELDLVTRACKQYDNIESVVYESSDELCIFDKLEQFYIYMDQPFRAVFNMEWILAALESAVTNNCKILLYGARGNETISWRGLTLGNYLEYHTRFIKFLRNFSLGLFKQFIKYGLNTKINAAIIRKFYTFISDPQYVLLIDKSKEIKNYMRSLHLWYGIEAIDPTGNLSLVQFCYDVPEWVYYRGSKYFEVRKLPKLKRRLLVREALEGLVPAEIRLNQHRGEQAADWYYQFNKYTCLWEKQLMDIAAKNPMIWKIYSKKYVLDLLGTKPIDPQSKQFDRVKLDLIQTLSSAFFINYLNNEYN